MRRRKIIIASIILIIILVVGVLCGISIYKVNTQYPDTIKISYQKGDTVQYNKTQFTVTKKEILNEEELEALAKNISEYDTKDGLILGEHDAKCLLLTVTISTTNEMDKIQIPITLESGAWSNDFEYRTFLLLNGKNATLNPELKSGEVVDLKLPFFLYKNHFKKNQWENIDVQEFSLVFSLYPEKISLKV